MICPKCNSSYREGFYECADCKVPLKKRPVDSTHMELDTDLKSISMLLGTVAWISFGFGFFLREKAGVFGVLLLIIAVLSGFVGLILGAIELEKKKPDALGVVILNGALVGLVIIPLLGGLIFYGTKQ